MSWAVNGDHQQGVAAGQASVKPVPSPSLLVPVSPETPTSR